MNIEMNIEHKLRRASLIIVAGLLVQFLSLLPLHPLAFIAFVGLGVPIMGVGVLLFLFSLVTQPESAAADTPDVCETTRA
jgi:hypothetical protein